MSFNSNISALKTQRSLSQSSRAVTQSFERLATGLRINRASDDAAGLSIADKLKTDTRLYSQATRNVNDGISMLNIVNETLSSQTSIVTRLVELSEQSANGTLSSAQRSSLNAEYKALVKEFGRLGDTTKFNGLSLLKGDRAREIQNIILQAGITGASTSQISVNTADTATLSGTIDFSLVNGLSSFTALNTVQTLADIASLFQQKFYYTNVTDSTGQSHEVIVGILSAFNDPTNLSMAVFARGSEIGVPAAEWSLTGTFTASALLTTDPETGLYVARPDFATLTDTISNFTTGGTATVNINVSGLRFIYSGAEVANPPTTVQDTASQPGITAIDFTGVETQSRAKTALTILKNRLTTLSSAQGEFGALASRLETSLSVTSSSRESVAAAESRIRDVDVAEESSALIASQIRQQAGSAILSQAINQPALLLRLLTET